MPSEAPMYPTVLHQQRGRPTFLFVFIVCASYGFLLLPQYPPGTKETFLPLPSETPKSPTAAGAAGAAGPAAAAAIAGPLGTVTGAATTGGLQSPPSTEQRTLASASAAASGLSPLGPSSSGVPQGPFSPPLGPGLGGRIGRGFGLGPGAGADGVVSARGGALTAFPGTCKMHLWQAIRASSAAPYYLDDFSAGEAQ